MKLILRSDLAGLGKRGDIVEVSDGYGRNYLLPRKLALVATDGAVDQAARMRRARDLRDAHDRDSATTIASALVPKVIEIVAKAGSEGRLFGSVTAADVAAAVARPDRHRARPQATRGRPDQDARPAHRDRPIARRRVVPDHARRRRRRLNGPSTGLWVRGTTAMSPAWARTRLRV